jgi:hypothetical protein
MPWQLFELEMVRYEGVGFEVCFDAIVRPVKEYLHEKADGDDLWIPAWTTE